MKSLFIYFYSFILVCGLSFNCNAQEFIPVFEDVPLMNGLTHIETDDVVFGNEESSYREAYLSAQKKLSFKKVTTFYQKTLPQLGWKVFSESEDTIGFERENAILEIRKINFEPLKISISLKNRS